MIALMITGGVILYLFGMCMTSVLCTSFMKAANFNKGKYNWRILDSDQDILHMLITLLWPLSVVVVPIIFLIMNIIPFFENAWCKYMHLYEQVEERAIARMIPEKEE